MLEGVPDPQRFVVFVELVLTATDVGVRLVDEDAPVGVFDRTLGVGAPALDEVVVEAFVPLAVEAFPDRFHRLDRGEGGGDAGGRVLGIECVDPVAVTSLRVGGGLDRLDRGRDPSFEESFFLALDPYLDAARQRFGDGDEHEIAGNRTPTSTAISFRMPWPLSARAVDVHGSEGGLLADEQPCRAFPSSRTVAVALTCDGCLCSITVAGPRRFHTGLPCPPILLWAGSIDDARAPAGGRSPRERERTDLFQLRPIRTSGRSCRRRGSSCRVLPSARAPPSMPIFQRASGVLGAPLIWVIAPVPLLGR